MTNLFSNLPQQLHADGFVAEAKAKAGVLRDDRPLGKVGPNALGRVPTAQDNLGWPVQAAHNAPPSPTPRALDANWHARHVRWQAEGRIPAGRTPLLYEDGTPVFDRIGRPRMWSQHVAVSMRPGQRGSRSIAAERARAEACAAEAARLSAEAAKLRSLMMPSLRPRAGRLWSIETEALLLIGPSGGIAIPASAIPALESLAKSGRHTLDARSCAAVQALAPRLDAVGLRIDLRKTGLRIARAR